MSKKMTAKEMAEQISKLTPENPNWSLDFGNGSSVSVILHPKRHGGVWYRVAMKHGDGPRRLGHANYSKRDTAAVGTAESAGKHARALMSKYGSKAEPQA
jgi:hypothetical protein